MEDDYDPNLAYFPDKSLMTKYEIEYYEEYPSKITRRLTQSQLHQLVYNLLNKLSVDEELDVVITKPNWMFTFIKRIDIYEVIKESNLPPEEAFFQDPKEGVILLDNLPIEEIAYRGNRKYVPIYNSNYYFRSPEQESSLKELLPTINFDYPSKKINEADYLESLSEENKELKETLTKVLGKDLTKIVHDYQLSPDKIGQRQFLESRVPEPGLSLIGEYLDIEPGQY